MIQKVTLPDIGPAFESLAIERWLKKEGDAVAAGDILCEVAIDKAILEVESRHAGLLLRILVPAGSPVPAGAVVAVIGKAGDKVPKSLLTPARSGRKAAAAGAEGVVPLTPIRRLIASRMLRSKTDIPCYYLEIDADVTDLVALRGKLERQGLGPQGHLQRPPYQGLRPGARGVPHRQQPLGRGPGHRAPPRGERGVCGGPRRRPAGAGRPRR